MNHKILCQLLDELWDDYRTAHCRYCKHDRPYFECVETIKKLNKEQNDFVLFKLEEIRTECGFGGDAPVLMLSNLIGYLNEENENASNE